MGGGGPRPGGRYRLTNMPATIADRALCASIPTDRGLGGPGWIVTDRYDLDATMTENATQDELRAMMRRFSAIASPLRRTSSSGIYRYMSHAAFGQDAPARSSPGAQHLRLRQPRSTQTGRCGGDRPRVRGGCCAASL